MKEWGIYEHEDERGSQKEMCELGKQSDKRLKLVHQFYAPDFTAATYYSEGYDEGRGRTDDF